MVEGREFMSANCLEREVLELQVGRVGRSHCPLEHPGEILGEQHDIGV